MDNRPAVISPNFWIVALVLLTVVVGLVAVWRIDRSGHGGSGLPDAFDYEIEAYRKIDPALVHYERSKTIPTEMRQGRAVAVGPEDRIYVAGDRAVHVFDSAGSLSSKIELQGEPTCLAVGGPEPPEKREVALTVTPKGEHFGKGPVQHLIFCGVGDDLDSRRVGTLHELGGGLPT
jgi:hypothetical protein